jgi:hypothetical protein
MGALKSPDWGLGRELWPQNSIYEVVIQNGPTLGMLPKDGTFGETIRHIALGTDIPQGVGADFSDAKGNKTGSLASLFQFSAMSYYSIFSIQNKLIEQAKINEATIVKPYARESKNALLAWTRDMSAFIFGNGGGAFGKGDGHNGGTFLATEKTIVLADPSRARFFHRGMKVQLSATDGTSGSVKAGALTVAGVEDDLDSNAGIITFVENVLDVIPNALTSDYLFRRSNFGQVITGFDGWIPKSRPGTSGVPATLFGLDRTLNSRQLSGFRLNAPNLTIYESGMKMATALVNAGAKPDTWIMNTSDWNVFRSQLEGAGNLVRTTAPSSGIGDWKPGLTYDAIKLFGPKGEVKTVADPDCPAGRSYMLQMDTWSLASIGPMVRLVDGERTEEFADAKESRFAGWNQVQCEAPGYNGTIQHATGA